MCTVSYIPHASGFVLTSNRDEDPGRKTIPPVRWEQEGATRIEAPVDKEKNGTWIATDHQGRAACLLNGAFEFHHRNPPYRMSRGALIPMAFQADSFFEFFTELHPHGVEPFTLVLIDEHLMVIKWDGRKKQVQFLSKTKPQLWSSATLYSSEAHQHKLDIYTAFLKDHDSPGADDLLHLHGLHGAPHFVLRRPEVQTVSITQIIVDGSGSEMRYFEPFSVTAE